MTYKSDAKSSASAKRDSILGGKSASPVDPSVRLGALQGEPRGSVPMREEMHMAESYRPKQRADKRARGGRIKRAEGGSVGKNSLENDAMNRMADTSGSSQRQSSSADETAMNEAMNKMNRKSGGRIGKAGGGPVELEQGAPRPKNGVGSQPVKRMEFAGGGGIVDRSRQDANGRFTHNDEGIRIQGKMNPMSFEPTGSEGQRARYASGGRVKPSTTVNIVMSPKSGDDKPPMPMPIPVPAPSGPPPMAGGPPMGAPPPMMPPQGAPLMRSYGGRVPHLGEAKGRTDEMRQQYGNKKGFATGGRVKSYPSFTAGAGSAEGRIQKEEAYGTEPPRKGRK